MKQEVGRKDFPAGLEVTFDNFYLLNFEVEVGVPARGRGRC